MKWVAINGSEDPTQIEEFVGLIKCSDDNVSLASILPARCGYFTHPHITPMANIAGSSMNEIALNHEKLSSLKCHIYQKRLIRNNASSHPHSDNMETSENARDNLLSLAMVFISMETPYSIPHTKAISTACCTFSFENLPCRLLNSSWFHSSTNRHTRRHTKVRQ